MLFYRLINYLFLAASSATISKILGRLIVDGLTSGLAMSLAQPDTDNANNRQTTMNVRKVIISLNGL